MKPPYAINGTYGGVRGGVMPPTRLSLRQISRARPPTRHLKLAVVVEVGAV